MTDKVELRRQIRDQRRQLAPAWIRQTSDRIQQRLLALAEWNAARQVCCYLATAMEVQTGRILDAGWQAHKRIWAPAFHPAHASYECALLKRDTALKAGPHQIPEPEKPDWSNPENLDLVVIPGLAFDPQGNRIGHGKGHYDNFLARAAMRTALKIGLAFAFQMRARVAVTAHDVGLDIVVTEDSVLHCRGKQPDH